MMASLKLMTAVMVALFAVGLEAKGPIRSSIKGLYGICSDLRSSMNELSPNGEADAKATFELAESLFRRFDTEWGSEGRRLKAVLDAVVNRSNCGNSRLDIVQTVAYCKLSSSKSTKSLDEATREYARECLTADYIRKRVKSSLISKARNLTKVLDDQFFVDYNSEIPEDRQFDYGPMDENKFAKAMAKVILRDPQEDMQKITENVQRYLRKRLMAPCSIFNEAFSEVTRPLAAARSYLDDYEKLISSLDESTRKQFYRHLFCDELYDGFTINSVSNKIADHLKSGRA